MKNEITGVLIDPEIGIAETRTIEASTEGYFSILRCSDVEIISCTIGGRRFDIFYGGEEPRFIGRRPSALDRFRRPKLYGPLFVVKAVWETGPESLNDGDAAYILDHVRKNRVPFRTPSIALYNVSLK